MMRIKELGKAKAFRRVAPLVFVAVAGVALAACGSSGASGGAGEHHDTTTTTSGSGGAAY
jgi:ABC-type glycerol-3-phosphate transport system substrate-binding protein